MIYYRSIVLCLVLFTSLMLNAQTPLPQVIQAFNQKFSGAQNVEWQAHKNHVAANFVLNDTYSEALFTKNGKWIQTNEIITDNELPKRVKKCWQKKYSNIQSVNTLMKITKKKKSSYSISFETETHLVDLIFNKRGKIIKKNEALIDPEG